MVKNVTWMGDQMPEFSGHAFKDLTVECTFSCKVAIPYKPWSRTMEECCNLELLSLQKGTDETWVIQTNTDASKCNFENIYDNQI